MHVKRGTIAQTSRREVALQNIKDHLANENHEDTAAVERHKAEIKVLEERIG